MRKIKAFSAISPKEARRAGLLLAGCRAALLAWFDENARDLPWRAALPAASANRKASRGEKPLPLRSPYAVWVSEIMLQQTVVAAVIPHFQRWMRTFPDVEALAVAAPEEVLRAWAGLGYYARARNLHKGAQVVAARGEWPSDAAAWREIPGVGEYTAGAIASLAFGLHAPILDGNVVRVFSRLIGLNFLPGAGAAEKRAYWDLARLWVGASGVGASGVEASAVDADDETAGSGVARPGALNEAVMELGALVCAPASPRCGECPLASRCAARRHGWTALLPPPKPRAKPETVQAVAVVARSPRGVLAEVRAPGAFLAGHVLFPFFFGEDAAAWKARFSGRFPGWRLEGLSGVATVRHTIMATRYEVEILVCSARPGAVDQPLLKNAPAAAAVRWLPEETVGEILTNALARKIWGAATGR